MAVLLIDDNLYRSYFVSEDVISSNPYINTLTVHATSKLVDNI